MKFPLTFWRNEKGTIDFREQLSTGFRRRRLDTSKRTFCNSATSATRSDSSIASVFVDTISLAIALTGLWFAGQDFGKVIYGKITFVLAGVSAAAAAVSLAGHINAAAKGE